MYAQQCLRTADIIITTALIPGKPAPKHDHCRWM
jgi:NAD/NADP transhydrogenase alpha subunit